MKGRAAEAHDCPTSRPVPAQTRLPAALATRGPRSGRPCVNDPGSHMAPGVGRGPPTSRASISSHGAARLDVSRSRVRPHHAGRGVPPPQQAERGGAAARAPLPGDVRFLLRVARVARHAQQGLGSGRRVLHAARGVAGPPRGDHLRGIAARPHLRPRRVVRRERRARGGLGRQADLAGAGSSALPLDLGPYARLHGGLARASPHADRRPRREGAHTHDARRVRRRRHRLRLRRAHRFSATR